MAIKFAGSAQKIKVGRVSGHKAIFSALSGQNTLNFGFLGTCVVYTIVLCILGNTL